jgi:hypothetical protein
MKDEWRKSVDRDRGEGLGVVEPVYPKTGVNFSHFFLAV